MITVAPGATFEATTSKFAHSATVGFRIRDNAGADFLARTVSGVTEDVTVGTSAVFRRTSTAPTVSGQWTIVWDDGTSIDTEELVVSYTASTPVTTSLYITPDEMKSSLSLTGQSYADADIERACEAVSRAIDEAARGDSHFYQATETRYYTPDLDSWPYTGYYNPWREIRLEIDDLVSASSVTIDTGAGTYSTTWTEGTDFFLDPANAATVGKPYEELVVRIVGGRYLPAVQRAVKITGVFGWPSVPSQVSQYAQIFAAQLILRSRQAPFGILMQGIEVGATARLMRYDPDFERLLGFCLRPKLFL